MACRSSTSRKATGMSGGPFESARSTINRRKFSAALKRARKSSPPAHINSRTCRKAAAKEATTMTSIDKDDQARGGLLNRTIEFSLRNRLLVAFAITLALFLGLVAFRAMETDLFPDL